MRRSSVLPFTYERSDNAYIYTSTSSSAVPQPYQDSSPPHFKGANMSLALDPKLNAAPSAWLHQGDPYQEHKDQLFEGANFIHGGIPASFARSQTRPSESLG